MIEVQAVQTGNLENIQSFQLPEREKELRKRIYKLGGILSDWEVQTVHAVVGSLDGILEGQNLEDLNTLALRLVKLRVDQLEQLSEICEREPELAFSDLFFLLDEWDRPSVLKEMEVLFPARLQIVGKEPIWRVSSLSVEEAKPFLPMIQAFFVEHRPVTAGQRGLASYLEDNLFEKHVYAVEPLLRIRNDALYVSMQCRMTEWLNDVEEAVLRDTLIREWTFGWGNFFGTEGILIKDVRVVLHATSVGTVFERKQAFQENGSIPFFQFPKVLLLDVYPEDMDEEETAETMAALPVSFWGLEDQLEQLAVKKEEALSVCFFQSLLPNLETWLWSKTENGETLGRLSDWNRLAWRLVYLDFFSQRFLEDQIAELEGITSMLELKTVLEDWIETSKVQMPVSEGGRVIPRISYEATIPKENESLVYYLWVDGGETLMRYGFPADSQEGALSTDAWEAILSDTVCIWIDCRVPRLSQALYQGIHEFHAIETLSKCLLQLNQRKQIPKYKAILERRMQVDLKGAIWLATHLNQYSFYPNCRSLHTFGRQIFEEIHRKQLSREERETIRFDRYGACKMAKLGVTETSYGYIKPRRNDKKGGDGGFE